MAIDKSMIEKIENVLGKERVNEVFECATLQTLIAHDPHLNDSDIMMLRKGSRFIAHENPVDVQNMLDDFKSGIVFIEAVYKIVGDRNDGHEDRPDQIRGSKLMYLSAYFNSNFIGEYPTGSGKSFMYLIFAAAAFGIRNQKSIVATAGISLQEQLKEKDIPFIANVFFTLTKNTLPFVILKGRQNYACPKKLAIIDKAIKVNADVAGVKDMSALKSYMSLIPKNFSGDLSDIDISPSYEIRKAVTCKDSREMKCNSCELKSDGCPFYKIRTLSSYAGVVVINYHVLMTEVDGIQSLGKITGGVASNYIFDEAHEIAKISRDFSHKKINTNSFAYLKGLFTTLEKTIDDNINPNNPLSSGPWGDANEAIESMKSDFAVNIMAFHESSMRAKNQSNFNTNILAHDEIVPIEWMTRGLSILKGLISTYLDSLIEYTGYTSLDSFISVANETPIEDMSPSMAMAIPVVDEGMNSIDEIISMQHTVNLFCMERVNDDFVLWTDTDDEGRVSLNFKKVKVNSLAKAMYNVPTISTTSVSATLSTGGNFDLYKSENSILNESCSFEIIGESPFNLREQEVWYVPQRAISAKGAGRGESASTYDDYVAENIVEIIKATGGGVLALFTSVRAMRLAYTYAIGALPNYHIYAQKEMPNKALVQHFSNNRDSVLFATRSFFTGIDVKGASLRCVVLDKLPFDNISDPVMRVLSSQQDGFRKYTVPFMLTTLKQIVGRGIRSKTDKCVIAVMDARLITTFRPAVTKTFFMGTNPPRRTMSIDAIRKFNEEFIKEDIDDDLDIPF